MANAKASAALRALIDDGNPTLRRSETARLNEVIDDVEAALAAGITQAAILTTLQQQGFSFTKRSFENALYRLRKRRKQQPTTPEMARNKHALPEHTATPESSEAKFITPADLRKIRKQEIDLDKYSEE